MPTGSCRFNLTSAVFFPSGIRTSSGCLPPASREVPAPQTSEVFVETIAAAIIAGLLLLWGGVLALLKMVDQFENKHVLGLGLYTTAVAGLVMGLVLFIAHERQREHRAELQKQMEGVTERLGDLSERLVSQLAEKADLTASEFEVRSRLQNEKVAHKETRARLGELSARYSQLEGKLDEERRARLQYQEDQDQEAARRFRKEEERYEGIRDVLDLHRDSMKGMQKQLARIQSVTTRLKEQVTGLRANQNSLTEKVDSAAGVQDLNSRKLDAVTRSQASLYREMTRTMAQVDSLYIWKRK